MTRMGQKTLRVMLSDPIDEVPKQLSAYDLHIIGGDLVYTYDTKTDRTGITSLLADLQKAGLKMTDLQTQQSTLEEIFVSLVSEGSQGDAA